MAEFTVRFKPINRSIKVAKGTDLLTAAVKCGIFLNASCGGEGLCGKCNVVVGGAETLACQTIVERDIEVGIPEGSLEHHRHFAPAAEESEKEAPLKGRARYPISPLVRKRYLKLTPPTADDGTSDLERITRELEPAMEGPHVSAKLASVKNLSEVMRDADFKVTAAIGYKEDALEILSVEPGDTSSKIYGFAFDIGTTTVAGELVDLKSGKILGTRIAFNKQASYGSDVITRIIHGSNPKGLEDLNEAVGDNINEIILSLLNDFKINPADVYAFTFAGNMTMMHLLLKIDPSNIRKPPYIPATTVFPAIHSSEAGIDANPRGVAYFIPGVATYVGGDTVAGVLACGLNESQDLELLIDIGTNGEIVLGNKEWMISAAASAGPAFEGSGLEAGTKAASGAIRKVEIDKSLGVKFDVIGKVKPKGICGSGYIDLLCQMLKTRIIGKDGKIDRRADKSGRIRKGKDTYEFVVAFAKDTATGKDIVITEDDIDNLKRAKAAIYSAIIALSDKVGKSLSDVKKIYIAGGFGNYLNIENAIFIGLLPDIKRGVYEFVGNSSLAGARMSLLSREAFAETYDIHKNITYVDLSAEAAYMDEYVASLFFPHTDIERFPSVRL